jgi:PHP family Zn ribbon phosphoesterase
MFAAGNFEAPFLVHAVNPPGVATMKELREKIEYKFGNIDRGGRVRIRTSRGEALKAVHDFLRFQIKEHHTGDSPEISKEIN